MALPSYKKLAKASKKGDGIVLVLGNPIDGINLVGMFASCEDAENYAEKHAEGEWWVTTLDEPDWREAKLPLPKKAVKSTTSR